jgi:hypothetical protein
MDGHTNEGIAAQLGYHGRTVEGNPETIRVSWQGEGDAA